MRCTYCNWNNPEGLTRCQKCNRPLERIKSDNTAAQTSSAPSGGEDWKSRETRVFGSSEQTEKNKKNVCPECSYPVMPDDERCPSCGAPLKKQAAPIQGATVLDANLASQHGRSTVLDASFSPTNIPDSSNPQLLPVEINLPDGEDIVLRRGDIVTIDGQKYLLR